MTAAQLTREIESLTPPKRKVHPDGSPTDRYVAYLKHLRALENLRIAQAMREGRKVSYS